MLQYQFRPLETWPGEKTKSRRKSPFSAVWSKTIDLLEHELNLLRAREIVIQAAVSRDQIRNDGMLRAGANPSWPGVILAFDSKHGPLMYPCDTFTDWQSNVRAIALSLEALRQVDRYGVTKRAEQYRGFEALPPPRAENEGSKMQAASAMLHAAGYEVTKISITGLLTGSLDLQKIYRQAAAATHPDAGGNVETFKKVNEAYELLKSK